MVLEFELGVSSSSKLHFAQVGNITQMIAYPDAIYNETYLLESSLAVNVTQGKSYFLTAQTAQSFAFVENLAELHKPVNKSRLVHGKRKHTPSL